jgi:hypothetical protein
VVSAESPCREGIWNEGAHLYFDGLLFSFLFVIFFSSAVFGGKVADSYDPSGLGQEPSPVT